MTDPAEVAIISGNDGTREVLRSLLRLHRHLVREEGRGLKDVQRLVREGFQGIVVVDAELADGEWGEAVACLREGKGRRAVLLVSPFYGPEFEARAQRQGAQVLLPRPFESFELLEALDRAQKAL